MRVITKDFVEMDLKSYILYRKVNLEKGLIRMENESGFIKFRAMTELLYACLTLSLDEILHNREAILDKVSKNLGKDLEEFGIKLVDIQIESIQMMPQLTHALARKALVEVETKSNIMLAKNSLDVASMELETTNILSQSPVTFQLEYFDLLKRMGASKKTVLMMPDSVIGDLNNLPQDEGNNGGYEEEETDGVIL